MSFMIAKLKSRIAQELPSNCRSITHRRFFCTDFAKNCLSTREKNLQWNLDGIFATANNHFSSAVMLAFDDMKQETMTNEDLSKLRRSAQSILLNSLNQGSNNHRIEQTRRAVGEAVEKILPTIRTDSELIVFASCMAIIMPRSERSWLSCDKEICMNSSIFSLNSLSLFTAVLLSASKKLRISVDRLITPETIAKLILNSTTTISIIGTNEDFITQQQSSLLNDRIETCLDNTPAKISTPSLFPENEEEKLDLKNLGSGTHINIRIIIQVGLYLQLLSKCNERNNLISIVYTENLKILSDLSQSLLTSKLILYPIKVLEPLWREIPTVKLADSSTIYRDLYKQISYSLSVNPMQIKNQETLVKSLLESMIISKVLDRKLINEIFDIIDHHGYDKRKYGPIFFGILAELDMTTLASKILTFLLNSESLELNNNSFTISKESKLCIYEKLSSIKEEYRCSDLTLALSTFGMEKKTTLYYRIIERIEGELSSKIVQMKIRDVLNILNAYSYSKRLYPGIINGVNHVIQCHVGNLTREELEKVLWANAHLNNRTAYNSIAADQYFTFFSKRESQSTSSLSSSLDSFKALVRSLWSLAVLEELSLQRYLEVEEILLKYSNLGDGTEMAPSTEQMLCQILTELRIKAEVDNFKYPNDEKLKKDFENIVLLRHWEKESTKVARSSNVITSHTHKDISNILLNMGIPHENEKMINNLYIVDILLSRNIFSTSLSKENKGIIIEIDGPRHFENYMNGVLGPTSMKKRHLSLLGYTVKTLPHWQYNINDTMIRKKKNLNIFLSK